MAGVESILGNDIFKYYDVCFCFPRKEIIMKSKQGELNNTGMNVNNEFVELVLKAKANKWCTRWFCTTCGSQHFRSALKEIGAEELSEALCSLTPSEIMALPNVDDCLKISFNDMRSIELMERVLDSWLDSADDHIRFVDMVIFNIMRGLGFFGETREKWINKCVELAIKTRDTSLIESLLLTIGGGISSYLELVKIIKEKTESSKIGSVFIDINKDTINVLERDEFERRQALLREEENSRAYEQRLSQQRVKRSQRLAILSKLSEMSPLERLDYIANDECHPLQYYPQEFAKVDNEIINKLNSETKSKLLKKCMLYKKGAWRKLALLLSN